MKPYEPKRLPLDAIDWPAHVTLIGRANAALARYDGMLQSIVNPLVLLSPLTTREAVLSSRIEGTQASLGEVLEFEADAREPIDPSRQVDILEILNYRRAMSQAVSELETRPFSLNLLKQLHATLLDSVRGRDRSPGRFRRCQNYVALPGEPIERASYVPPAWEQVDPAMDNWEKYLHSEEKDPLVQLAIAKAQFELIHPLQDGNGRLGRMLVPIFLYEKNVLSSPMFYLSAYLEAHREVYYHRLRAISQEDDWNGWVTFFLMALVEQAGANTLKTRKIISLYERMKEYVPQATHSHYAIQAIDALFDRPIFQASDFAARAGVSKSTAERILRRLQETDIVHVLRPRRGRRAAVMAFTELVQIVED